MGWFIVIVAVPLVRTLEPGALAWLLAGGISYTGGTFFYHSRRVPFAHAIWHLFVLGGSVCQCVALGLQI